MRKWLPVIFYALVLFVLSHQPEIPSTRFTFEDKFLHLAAYSLFGFLCARAVRNRKPLLVAFLAATFYGVFDEFHQSFIPGRNVEAWDVVADAIGGLLGGWIYLRLKRWPRFSRIME